MTKLVTVVLVACAFAAVGCEDKKAEAPKPGSTAASTATATGAAKQAPAPAKTAAPGGW